MAALAHGGILVGLLTGSLGMIVAAPLIWLTQKKKPA
jgi:hypothetical protein